MIVITTMDSLPELCYECPCHDGENGQCDADKEKRYNLEYRPYWCPLKEIHNDQEGYVSVPFSWLVKFCTHIDFNEPMSDADREKLWKQKLEQQFNIDIPKKRNGAWEFVCHNPSYSPFDNSPRSLYRCTNCRYTTGSTTKYCPICGSKNQS